MHPRRVFLLSLNVLVVLAVLTTTLLGPLPISVASAHPRSAVPFATTAALSGAYGLSAQAFARAALMDATTPPCNAFPIALSTATIAGAQVGDTLGDIYNGTTPGNFGWLSWTGDPSEPPLVTSLTLPGNSDTYVNPNDPTDHTLTVGDWVSGKPGVSNSKAVRDALTALEGIDLTVPVWDEAQGNGANSQYHVIGFVQVQITAFQLPGANRITATYLGNTPCGGGTLPPLAGPSLNGATLMLSPSAAGPNITGTTQTLKATLKSNAGVPIPDIAVQFTISGANAQTSGATTDSNGIATLTYQSTASGTDSIQATATSGETTVTSNTASVSWVTPTQPVSTSTIWARVFPADGSGQFNATPSQTPAFTMSVPTIDFNPPPSTIPGNTSGVNEGSRPMVDVTTDLNGNYTGTIVLQGNGLQAGVGSLYFFNVVFTGSLTVSAAGDVTFNFFTDDGFVLGVGNGATRVSGPLVNPPASGQTAFEQFPVLGAYNVATPPVGNTVTLHFPGPGSYPYELDYSEGICCTLVVTATTVTANGTQGIPPTGSLTLSPNTVPTQPAGTQQTFSVTATDAAGNVLPNLPVQLTVTGANPQQLQATTDASGIATFSYTAALAGTDTVQSLAWVSNLASYSNQVTVQWSAPVSPPPTPPVATPGWIGSPASQSTQTGSVLIKLASGITLTSGTVDYWPTAEPGDVTTLATNVSGTGGATLATLDTTMLANGSYIVRLQGTNSSGTQLDSEVLVTVIGQYKPGRVTFSVTDLTVPVTGLPITIGRTYDSLLRNQSGDFGNGWNLTIGTPKLTVDPAHNVTLTLADGRRVTFAFTPQSAGGIFGFLSTPGYTPEAGVYGSLISNGCPLLAVSGGQYFCFPGTLYQPTTYTYTDPYGRTSTFDATTGTLTSLTDLDGNTLTFTQSGITSSAGNVRVAFTRDSAGRITQITDPAGNVYQYSYDSAGDLVSVTFPGVATPISYTYDSTHLLLTVQDPLKHPSIVETYYPDGRLETTQDPLGNTTSFSYDVTTNTTTVTAPDGGVTTDTYDAFGDLLSQTDPLGHKTTNTYDSNRNLLSTTDPLGHKTSYTYDSQGNRLSTTDPLGHTTSVTYNQFSAPTTLTDALGNTRYLDYDVNLHLATVQDSLGMEGSFIWDAHGQLLSQTDGNGQATINVYDQFGNVLSQTDALGHETYYTYDSLGVFNNRISY
jgi:YD repeat-containing protein